ncbi:MAG: hypothetical protein Q8P22_06790 [Chloroflexota bacterium]|nr:hypothetical protein [Chloroflexota bacterium]
MPKRNRAVERPMLMSVAADPPPPAEVAQPAPAELARPAPAEWAPQTEKEFVDFFLYLLKAPLILYPGWEDTFRDQWDKVLMERMIHHKDLFAQKMCTEYEAMLYISSATLVAPPSHDWYVIYMYLFRRWNKEAAQQIGMDDVPEKLNMNQQDDLARLRQWIFKGQRTHLKEKAKGISQETAKAPATEKKLIEVERPKLF